MTPNVFHIIVEIRFAIILIKNIVISPNIFHTIAATIFEVIHINTIIMSPNVVHSIVESNLTDFDNSYFSLTHC